MIKKLYVIPLVNTVFVKKGLVYEIVNTFFINHFKVYTLRRQGVTVYMVTSVVVMAGAIENICNS